MEYKGEMTRFERDEEMATKVIDNREAPTYRVE